MELLRHRPLSTRRGKAAPPWRTVAAILAAGLFVTVVIAGILSFRLSDVAHIDKAREKLACETGLHALRTKEAAYLSIDTSLAKLIANPEQKTIGTGLAPFLAVAFGSAPVTVDADYQQALTSFIQTVSDYRAGAITPAQMQDSADDLTLQIRKAAARTRTIINETLPQHC